MPHYLRIARGSVELLDSVQHAKRPRQAAAGCTWRLGAHPWKEFIWNIAILGHPVAKLAKLLFRWRLAPHDLLSKIVNAKWNAAPILEPLENPCVPISNQPDVWKQCRQDNCC